MRKCQRGGGGSDSGNESPADSPQLPRKTYQLPPTPQPSQMKSVLYNIFEMDKKWFVTIEIDGKKESYAVPKDILDRVHSVQTTSLG